PRSWLSSLLLQYRPVPITYSPPSAATRPWSPPRPPSRMSVPRPAICVDTVMAPRAPAPATRAPPALLRRPGGARERPGLGHDGGLPRVVLGVQDGTAEPGHGEPVRYPFGFNDVEGADQNRPPGGVRGRHLSGDLLLLLGHARVQPAGLVLAYARPVRRDHRHLQPVELAELAADRDRGGGHAAHPRIAPDQRLDRDAVQDLARRAGGEGLLGLDVGLQPVRQALQPGHPASGGADQLDPAVADDVIDVAPQQRVRVQGHVEPGQGVELVAAVEVDPAERVLGRARPRLGELDVAGVLVDLVVQARAQRPRD